jgi:hypothetical protein
MTHSRQGNSQRCQLRVESGPRPASQFRLPPQCGLVRARCGSPCPTQNKDAERNKLHRPHCRPNTWLFHRGANVRNGSKARHYANVCNGRKAAISGPDPRVPLVPRLNGRFGPSSCKFGRSFTMTGGDRQRPTVLAAASYAAAVCACHGFTNR